MGINRVQRLAVRTSIVVLAAVALVRLGHTAAELAERAGRDRSPAEQTIAGGRTAGTDAKFVEWARRRLANEDSYWIASPQARSDGAFYQWLTYRLMPRREATGPARADALIWHNDTRGRARLHRPWRVYNEANGAAVAVRDHPR